MTTSICLSLPIQQLHGRDRENPLLIGDQGFQFYSHATVLMTMFFEC